jgi:hypothetical protein
MPEHDVSDGSNEAPDRIAESLLDNGNRVKRRSALNWRSRANSEVADSFRKKRLSFAPNAQKRLWL